MQRDLELVRHLLLEIERHPHGFVNGSIDLDGYTDDQIGYHLKLMIEAGLIEGRDTTCMSDRSPRMLVRSMTWQGHDFLDSVRDEKIWKSIKVSTSKVAGVTFEILKQLAVEALKTQLGLSGTTK